MDVLYILINEISHYAISIGKPLFQQITHDDTKLLTFVQSQMEKNEIPEENLRSLQVSTNNVNYREILLSTLTEQSENDVIWSEGATKLLLDKYEQYLIQVGPLKKYKTKKIMWEKIALDLKDILGVNKTYVQVENRFKTIMKRKKKAVDNNKRSGQEEVPVEYEEEMSKISNIDDSIQPEVRMGVNKTLLTEKSHSSKSQRSKTKTSNKPFTEVLWELHKLKEEERTKRHNEKMNLLRELGQMLCNNK